MPVADPLIILPLGQSLPPAPAPPPRIEPEKAPELAGAIEAIHEAVAVMRDLAAAIVASQTPTTVTGGAPQGAPPPVSESPLTHMITSTNAALMSAIEDLRRATIAPRVKEVERDADGNIKFVKEWVDGLSA